MTIVFLVVFIAAIAGTTFGLLPLLGVSPSAGISFSTDPLLTISAVVLGLIALIALSYASAIAAAWVALHSHAHSKVETEFRCLLSWFKWDPNVNGILFHKLFGRH